MELKPCPFCGALPGDSVVKGRVVCYTRDCAMYVVGATPEQWNRRAASFSSLPAEPKMVVYDGDFHPVEEAFELAKAEVERMKQSLIEQAEDFSKAKKALHAELAELKKGPSDEEIPLIAYATGDGWALYIEKDGHTIASVAWPFGDERLTGKELRERGIRVF